MPWNFARRLLAPSVADWCPRHCASGAMLEVGDVATDDFSTTCYDIYHWNVRIQSDSPIHCIHCIQMSFHPTPSSQDRFPKCPGVLCLHLGSTVLRSKVAAVTGGQECGKLCPEPGSKNPWAWIMTLSGSATKHSETSAQWWCYSADRWWFQPNSTGLIQQKTSFRKRKHICNIL